MSQEPIDYEKAFTYYRLITGGCSLAGAREDGYVKGAEQEALWAIVKADPEPYSQPSGESPGAA